MFCPSVPTTEEALTTRLLHSTIHALEVFSVYLGKELGLYAALSLGALVTSPELAGATGIAPRDAREWLEPQAVAGLLRVESATAPADERRYWLPAEHVNLLVNEDHAAHLAPLAQMVAGIGGVLEQVARAYRTGGGVPYALFGPGFAKGRPASTGRHSWRTSSSAGFLRCPTFTGDSRPHACGSRTSAAAPAGRQSAWRAHTPEAKSSVR